MRQVKYCTKTILDTSKLKLQLVIYLEISSCTFFSNYCIDCLFEFVCEYINPPNCVLRGNKMCIHTLHNTSYKVMKGEGLSLWVHTFVKECLKNCKCNKREQTGVEVGSNILQWNKATVFQLASDERKWIYIWWVFFTFSDNKSFRGQWSKNVAYKPCSEVIAFQISQNKNADVDHCFLPAIRTVVLPKCGNNLLWRSDHCVISIVVPVRVKTLVSDFCQGKSTYFVATIQYQCSYKS